MSIRNRLARMSHARRRAALALGAGIAITSFLLGLQVGIALSPDYDSEDAAVYYLATHLEVDELSTRDVFLSSTAGIRTFRYRLSRDSIYEELPSPLELKGRKPPRRNMLQEHEKIAALAGIGAAPVPIVGLWSRTANFVDRASAPERVPIYVVGGLLTIAGGGLGFWIGYNDKRDYDLPNFLKGMRNKTVWRSFAFRLQACKSAADALTAVRRSYDVHHQTTKETLEADAALAKPCDALLALARSS